MLELEDVHMPGSQRAAVDIAVAERLRESGVLTEDDICAAAYLELDGNEPLASIHEDGEVASRSGGIGESDISDMTDTKMAPPTSPTPRVIPEVPPGFAGRPGISGIGRSREGRSPGAPEAKVVGSPEPVTPTARSSSKKARRSPEHNTPGRNRGDANMEDHTESDHHKDLYGTITDDDTSSVRYGTPHEPKRKASVTPKGRSSHASWLVESRGLINDLWNLC